MTYFCFHTARQQLAGARAAFGHNGPSKSVFRKRVRQIKLLVVQLDGVGCGGWI